MLLTNGLRERESRPKAVSHLKRSQDNLSMAQDNHNRNRIK